MSEDTYTFEQARARLEEIAKQAKGASLEQCLDLLEEGVKLANICTEKIDHTQWREATQDAEEESSPDESEDAVPSIESSAGQEPSDSDPDRDETAEDEQAFK